MKKETIFVMLLNLFVWGGLILLAFSCEQKREYCEYTTTFEQVYIAPGSVMFLVRNSQNQLVPVTFGFPHVYVIKQTSDKNLVNKYKVTHTIRGVREEDSLFIYIDNEDNIKAGSHNKGKFGTDYYNRIK